MQHDSSKTFREIHGSSAQLVASMKEIKKHVVETREHQKIPLRFITFHEHKRREGNVVHLRLTSPDEFDALCPDGSDYIAVSYTWNQPVSLEQTFMSQIPEYVPWKLDTHHRSLRCPKLVLHRVLQVSLEYCPRETGRSLVWINQECIHQDDPDDVQRHLDCMDAVYVDATVTIVPLAQLVSSVSDLNQFELFLKDGVFSEEQFRDAIYRPNSIKDIMSAKLESLSYVLGHLRKDDWFSSIWTYHERNLSRRLIYLIPISPMLRQPETEFYKLFNLVIPFEPINLIPMLKLHTKVTETALTKDQQHLRSNILAHITHNLKPMDWETARFPSIEVFNIMKIFTTMESLCNSVVTDRLSILASIASFSRTLKCTRLNTPEQSFKTCLLFFLSPNLISE